MGQIKVLKVTEGRGLDVRNNVIKTVQIVYMVDDHGPFSETGTPQEFQAGVMRQRMQEFAKSIIANSQ